MCSYYFNFNVFEVVQFNTPNKSAIFLLIVLDIVVSSMKEMNENVKV